MGPMSSGDGQDPGPGTRARGPRPACGPGPGDPRARGPGPGDVKHLALCTGVYLRLFLEQIRFCYITGHHKQYIQVDIIFNYMCHF